MKTTPCGKCGRPIAWVRTVNARSMPIDPEPVTTGNVIVRIEAGQYVASVLTKSDKVRPQGIAHMPHFATCPALNPGLTKPPPAPIRNPEPPAPEQLGLL